MKPEKEHRIEFYSKGDGASGYNLLMAESILRNFDGERKYEINDVIELYQIKLYFDNDVYLEKWTNDDIEKFRETVKRIWEVVCNFFININNNNIIEFFESLEFQFHGSFWSLIEQLKIYKNISEENFIKLLDNENLWIRHILEQQRLVNYFGSLIRDYLLKNKTAAEFLLTQFEEKHLSENKELYFPNCLSIKDKEAIIVKYLESEDPNINYVRLIVNSRDSSNLKLTPHTRLKAQKVEREKNNEILESGNTVDFGNTVSFSKVQIEPKKVIRENTILKISYSTQFIEKNMDYYSLFSNFSMLFEYIDRFGNITLISKKEELNVFEKISVHSKNEYQKGVTFRIKSNLSHLELFSYSRYLKEFNIRIEDILHDFINKYVNENFGLSGLKINLPSEKASNLEKARMIAPEIESLLKQYKLFVEDGKVDHELLQISSASIKYKDIPSLVKKKYAYGIGEEFLKLKHIFFSDQSSMFYVKPFENKYRNFYSLLTKENVSIDSFKPYQRDTIDLLIQEEYLLIDSKGFVRIKELPTIFFIGRLFSDEVINYWRFSESLRTVLDNMEKKGLIYFGNTFLSESEQRYFNFYLNKSECTNGLDLRNKYVHGTNSNSDAEHEHAYYIFLKLLILIMLKIEDDLIIKNYLLD